MPASSSTITSGTTRWRPRRRVMSVRVQGGVQLDGLTLAGHRLDRAGQRVAAEQQSRDPGEVAGLDGVRLVRGGALLTHQDHLGAGGDVQAGHEDRKSTRLNSSHVAISYAVFCLKKKN